MSLDTGRFTLSPSDMLVKIQPSHSFLSYIYYTCRQGLAGKSLGSVMIGSREVGKGRVMPF